MTADKTASAGWRTGAGSMTPGRIRPKVTRRDLHDAIEALLDDRPVAATSTHRWAARSSGGRGSRASGRFAGPEVRR